MTNRHRVTRSIAGVAVIASALTGAACSTKAAADSAYCKEARAWAVHELTPIDDSDPAVYRPYWAEYMRFVDKAAAVAPAAIDADWAIYKATVAKQVALLEKYDYDQAKAESQATAEEKKVYEAPGEKSDNAFDEILRYEADTCSAALPLPAKVTFKKQPADAYCALLNTENEAMGTVAESGFSPKLVRTVMASSQDDKTLVRLAPAAIKDDVVAQVKWSQEHQRPVLKKYGYDIRKLMRDGSNSERAAAQLTDKAIRDHVARVEAFDEQTCSD